MIDNDNKKVLVAMSGGVDSAITAYLLKQQGYQVTGLHLIMDPQKIESQQEAETLAKFLEIDLITKDITQQFEQQIKQYFVSQYCQQLTPNPCVICNPLVKFATLIKEAQILGIQTVATGHYARIQQRQVGNAQHHCLTKAVDKKKDQSYFLYRLSEAQLSRIIFPLGEYTKDKVKEIAKDIHLPLKSKESQDVCFFLEGEGAKEFLSAHLQPEPGQIVDEQGAVLGQHRGLAFYTQGQRTGLGLSGGPYYVIGKNTVRNELIVSTKREHPLLMNQRITITQANWINEAPVPGQKYSFRTRYQIKETKGTISGNDKLWTITLEAPQWAVAKGQSLVAYDGERVVGGGIISDMQ